MASSGEVAIATVDNNPVDLLSADQQQGMKRVVLINEDGAAGFFSVDGGNEWRRWPTGAKFVEINRKEFARQAVKFKRDAALAVNVTKLYAWSD